MSKEANKNRICQSVILALATFIAALTWGGLRGFFNGGSWIWPISGLLLMLVLLSLSWFLLKSKIILFTTLGIILVSFFVVFGFNVVYLIAVLAAFACFAVGSSRAIGDRKSRIKIQLNRTLKIGLPLLLTGLSIIIATAYFYSPMSLAKQEEITIPRALFDVVIEPAVNVIFKNISKNLNLSLEQIQLPRELDFLMSAYGGIDIGNIGEDLIKDQEESFYQSINQEINNLLKNYKQYIAISLAISLFFMLKFLSLFLMWLIILLSWLVFKILVKFEAIHIKEKAVLQETIEA